MTPRTEQFYRGLLLAYPYRHRLRYADEMMGVLMDEDDANSQEPALRRGSRRIVESLVLLRHGLAMRMRVRGEPGTWGRPFAAAAVVLATLTAVIGVQDFVRMGFSTGLFWGYSVYISPSWPVSALSILVLVFVLLRQQIPASLVALAAAGLGLWEHRHEITGIGQWGTAESAISAQDLALLVPSLVLALLLLKPGVVAQTVEIVRQRTILLALAAGTVTALWTDYGMSMIWAAWIAGLVLVPSLVRGRVVLRAGALIAFAFGYLLLDQQADGSGSKMPRHGWALATWMGLLPVAILLVALVLIGQLDFGGVRQRFGRALEAYGRSIKDGDHEPV